MRVLALLGRNDDCRRRGEEALALVRRLGPRALESELLNSLGLSAAALGRQEEALALLREALDVAEDAGDPECLGLAYTNLSSILGSYCQFEEAVAVSLEGAEVARRLGVELVMGLWCIANAAENLVDLGRFDEADGLTARALEYDARDTTAVVLHLGRADLDRTPGSPRRPPSAISSSRASWAPPSYSLEFRAVEAKIAALDSPATGTLAGGAAPAARKRWCSPPRPRTRSTQPCCCRSGCGRRPTSPSALEPAGARRRRRAPVPPPMRCRRRGAALREAAGSGRTPSPEIEAHVATATAERARLDGASAPGHWAAAQAAWDELRMAHHAAYARWRRAEALLAAHGGREEAAALLAEAHSACLRMGAEPLRVEIDALARRARIELAAPATPPADTDGPAPAQEQPLAEGSG